MNILVTGATGFIGKHLITRLKENNNVHILVRPTSSWEEQLNDMKTFVFTDNISELVTYLKENEINGVIHLASLYVAEHKSYMIKDIVQSNIYLGTAILDACKQAGTKWFLNTGSIWQNYNSPDYSDEYHPVNLYAASKQAFMTIAQFYTETSNLRFCTLKLCDTYGPNDTRRKIYALFEQIAKSGEELKMSPGEQKIDIVHVDKVIDSFVLLANKLNRNEDLKNEYVVTSGSQRSLKEIAKQYEQDHNVKLNIIWGGREYRQREVMKPYIGNKL